MAGGKAAAKAAKKEKQAAKAARKAQKGAGLEEEVPIDEIIKQLEAKQAAKDVSTSTVAVTAAPTARSSFSLVSLKGPFFYLFGGEYYDSKVCKVFNDLYKWHPGKEDEEWRLITGTPCPKPRCGHQLCLYQDDLYLFGGEFATSNQFYHFRDTWKFDTKQNVWQEIPGVGPSARSGHRMVVCRNVLVLFGGFHDTSGETRCHNDVHLFFPQQSVWRKVVFPSKEQSGPSARSGVIMGATNDGVLVHGGYSKAKDSDKGAQGVTHTDSWWLDMTPVFEDWQKGIPVWEKLGKKGTPPKRIGTAAVTHKSTVYCFGGVADEDDGGLVLKTSLFYNDIATFDLASKRWGSFVMSASESQRKLSPGQTYAYLERRGKLWCVIVETSNPFQGLANLKPTDERVVDSNVRINVDPKTMAEPLPRMGAAVTVKDNYIYVAYGTLELGSRTIVLDDCWRIHVNGRSNWEVVMSGTYWQKDWQEDVSSSESEEEPSDLDDASSSGGSETESDDESSSCSGTEDEGEEEEDDSEENSEEAEPRPYKNEALKEYFDRTRLYWKKKVAEEGLADSAQGEKIVMQKSFQAAKDYFATAKTIKRPTK